MTPGVPKTALCEWHAATAPYAIIVGVYNEGEKFTRQLAALQPYRGMGDLIVADGGSSDGVTSPEAIAGKARALIVNEDVQRGLSVQYRAALHYALTQGYAGVIMMDGNGKDGADAIPRFIEKLNQGYDFIQGSRFLPGGKHENTPPDRVLGIRFVFNPIMNAASGFCYTDGMNGFKAASRGFLTDRRVQPFRDIFVRYSLQYYFNYIAPRLGFRVTEIPVSRRYPADGTPYSKISGLGGRLGIMAELLAVVNGRYNP
ncbi:MAG: glycosyltransferase family 2 protein [Pseudomonadota bacterium]|nr:glycosyltransferase family 2 protein [Pseudomonadota bacterium]MDE3038686.1 glycosyltransferase family 2 protein [Pseudomonadota bacterium]